MAVRVGVDVGGTFTKAVACREDTPEVVARAIVPTTHEAAGGVAEGVVAAVAEVARRVERDRLGPIRLVAHSTTQAVNALLEGDTATVGVLGIGRSPDLKRARKRTRVGAIRLAPGRSLATAHEFIDGTGGTSAREIEDAIGRLRGAGATSLCISEAFGVEDAAVEKLALGVAAELGIPACAGHELSGLYGLEMRTVTGALNASILPTALRTAEFVRAAVAADVPRVPLLVMRGDGGAADIAAMQRHPLLTAFSGPAASVAGALRLLDLRDGIVVEVGGTSTNVSAVRGGRPMLAYVRVLDHVTCVRSLDVRVVGVAGGSLIRVGRRLGRPRIEDVGPRSAHIAGLEYCCFADPGDLEGAVAKLVSPLPEDPAEYVVLETPSGRRFAPTLTCAANACGAVEPGSYAAGDPDAARAAFEVIGAALGAEGAALARRAVALGAHKIAGALTDAARDLELDAPTLVGLGGGAGALVPSVAESLDLNWHIPRDAEVISSVGDALSLVRVEIEGAMPRGDTEASARLHAEAERAAFAAGAAPASLQVESEAIPERRALRVVAMGSVALSSEVTQGAARVDEEVQRLAAKHTLHDEVDLVLRNDFYAVFVAGGAKPPRRRFAVIDRHGAVALSGEGHVLVAEAGGLSSELHELLPNLTRHLGVVSVAPELRLLRGTRLVDLTLYSGTDQVLEVARRECALANGDPVVAFVTT